MDFGGQAKRIDFMGGLGAGGVGNERVRLRGVGDRGTERGRGSQN